MYILCMYSLIVLKNSNELLYTHAKETRILITYVFLSQGSTSLNSVLILPLLFFVVVELFHLCIVLFCLFLYVLVLFSERAKTCLKYTF